MSLCQSSNSKFLTVVLHHICPDAISLLSSLCSAVCSFKPNLLCIDCKHCRHVFKSIECGLNAAQQHVTHMAFARA